MVSFSVKIVKKTRNESIFCFWIKNVGFGAIWILLPAILTLT